MLTLESVASAKPKAGGERPVIRIELNLHSHHLTEALLPIESGELLLIVKAAQSRSNALGNSQTEPDILTEIKAVKIPHHSDYLHHDKGLRIALYASIRINYLVARLNDPGDN